MSAQRISGASASASAGGGPVSGAPASIPAAAAGGAPAGARHGALRATPAGLRRRLTIGELARRAPAWTIAASLGVAYLLAAPSSADLAAASYRSALFGRVGFTLWDDAWFGGHYLPAYSVLSPALGWLIGPRLLAALSMTAAAALFTALIKGRVAARAGRVAEVWFALGAGLAVFTGRVPFALGLALALGALLAAQRRRRAAALALALACSLASPVSGALLALAALAWALTSRRRLAACLTTAALAPIVALASIFPEPGTEPFVASAFYPPLAAVLLIAVAIPRHRRGQPGQTLAILRTAALLYALALVGAYVLPTAVGGNVDRLGALVAGPVAACALAAGTPGGWRMPGAWRERLLLVLAPALLYWQASAPVADVVSAAGDPAVDAAYYTPLLGELRALGVGYSARPARIEVVPVADHWEARWVAPHVALARGWERQLDVAQNKLFYEAGAALTPARYRAWLTANAISYVALPDAPLDYSARAEARLLARAGALRAGAKTAAAAGEKPGARTAGEQASSYLREVWRSAHWRLFAVVGAAPLAQPPSNLVRLTSDSFTLRVPRAGTYEVRTRFTPYWAISDTAGCVRRAPGGWTDVQAERAGAVRVVIRFSPARVLDHGPRCD